jgi:hypothetical protein
MLLDTQENITPSASAQLFADPVRKIEEKRLCDNQLQTERPSLRRYVESTQRKEKNTQVFIPDII